MATAKYVPQKPAPRMVELLLDEAEATAMYQTLISSGFPSKTYTIYLALHHLLT